MQRAGEAESRRMRGRERWHVQPIQLELRRRVTRWGDIGRRQRGRARARSIARGTLVVRWKWFGRVAGGEDDPLAVRLVRIGDLLHFASPLSAHNP
jgi:hypothetical protein